MFLRVQDYATTTWSTYAWALYTVSVTNLVSSLQLSRLLTQSDMNLISQSFVSSVMNMTFPQALYIGYPNGDMWGFDFPCRATSSCSEPRYITSSVRTSWTSNYLRRYNVILDAQSNVIADYTALSSAGSPYDASMRPWFQTGKECGMLTNTGLGKTCISDAYTDAATGDVVLFIIKMLIFL